MEGGGVSLNFSKDGSVVMSKQHELKCMNRGNTDPCILQHQIKQCTSASGASRCNAGQYTIALLIKQLNSQVIVL